MVYFVAHYIRHLFPSKFLKKNEKNMHKIQSSNLCMFNKSYLYKSYYFSQKRLSVRAQLVSFLNNYAFLVAGKDLVNFIGFFDLSDQAHDRNHDQSCDHCKRAGQSAPRNTHELRDEGGRIHCDDNRDNDEEDDHYPHYEELFLLAHIFDEIVLEEVKSKR